MSNQGQANTYPQFSVTEKQVGVRLSQDSEGNKEASNLPSQSTPGNSAKGAINWMSSSYSGADIKAVVHLYGTGAQKAHVTELQETVNTLRESARTAFNERNDAEFDRLTALADSMQERITALNQLENQGMSTLVLDSLQTISVQSYREKVAVRGMGKSYPSGHTRGPRTISGSMIFTLIKEHPLQKLIKAMGDPALVGEMAVDIQSYTLLPDQLPPVDITIVFANEYGAISRMGIYGVEFFTDGVTLSSEDIFSEQILNFSARDIDIMSSVGTMKLSQIEKGIYTDTGQRLTPGQLLINGEEQYQALLDKIGLRRQYKGY